MRALPCVHRTGRTALFPIGTIPSARRTRKPRASGRRNRRRHALARSALRRRSWLHRTLAPLSAVSSPRLTHIRRGNNRQRRRLHTSIVLLISRAFSNRPRRAVRLFASRFVRGLRVGWRLMQRVLLLCRFTLGVLLLCRFTLVPAVAVLRLVVAHGLHHGHFDSQRDIALALAAVAGIAAKRQVAPKTHNLVAGELRGRVHARHAALEHVPCVILHERRLERCEPNSHGRVLALVSLEGVSVSRDPFAEVRGHQVAATTRKRRVNRRRVIGLAPLSPPLDEPVVAEAAPPYRALLSKSVGFEPAENGIEVQIAIVVDLEDEFRVNVLVDPLVEQEHLCRQRAIGVEVVQQQKVPVLLLLACKARILLGQALAVCFRAPLA
eukprot:Opistho-1_new@43349